MEFKNKYHNDQQKNKHKSTRVEDTHINI